MHAVFFLPLKRTNEYRLTVWLSLLQRLHTYEVLSHLELITSDLKDPYLQQSMQVRFETKHRI